MLLDNQDLMSEFFKRIRNDYPDLTYEQLKDILFAPWRFLKDEMESGNLRTVRFMYFGKFTVFPGRAKFMLRQNKTALDKGAITKTQYNNFKEMITKFLENEEKI